MRRVSMRYEDGSECVEGALWSHGSIIYDPRDPASIQRAQLALKARFGLGGVPTLCSEPEPSWLRRLWGLFWR